MILEEKRSRPVVPRNRFMSFEQESENDGWPLFLFFHWKSGRLSGIGDLSIPRGGWKTKVT